MTINAPHLTFEKIADLVEGRVDDVERSQATAHVAGCARCAEQASRLEQTVHMMRTDTAEHAPRHAIASAINSFRDRVIPAASGLKRLVAALTFDSLQMTPALGLREGVAAERQLAYAAGDHVLHLQVTASDERWLVSGQVLGECAEGEVELCGQSREEAKVALTSQCEFRLPPVASGDYSLLVRLSEIELEISDLKLGTQG